MQKCKGVSAEPSLLELCRATQHFDDGTSKRKGTQNVPFYEKNIACWQSEAINPNIHNNTLTVDVFLSLLFLLICLFNIL